VLIPRDRGSCTITITFTGDSTSRAILTVADDSTVGSHDVSLAFDVVD
jgi:hypothetical protein